ncbi:Clp protease [Nocardia puris]|uniref:Clp protease N-terminal domain-containing protein n=1 Tax=Nocardia puris TaxID=208602 RepID=UPI0018934A49|nr:Clp protease N-terminal domain-containing protein [Nocardia puris]MBF6365121.1 Clp protease [Nocardia puris]MBF6458906.1 Clp protease [Nocardia puris]
MFERFTKSARFAVVGAQEDARALRSPSIGVEHVLLGVLAHAEPDVKALLAEEGLTHAGVTAALRQRRRGEPLGDADAEALRSIGIDLDAVRESLEATFGENALDGPEPAPPRGLFGKRRASGHIPFTRDAKKVLELSLREALARQDKTIGVEHVLLGILRAPNDTTADLLGGAPAIAALRPKVHAHLDRPAA